MDFQQKMESEFYVVHEKLGDLFEAASRVCYRGGKVQGCILSCDTEIDVLVERLKGGGAGARGIKVRSEKSPYLIQVRTDGRRLAPEERKGAKAFIWEEKKKGIIYLLSCEDRENFERLSSKIERYLSPRLSKIFLRTSEIRSALNRLTENSKSLTLRVREYTSRSLIDDPGSHKRVRTNREWTDEDHRSVFEKLSEQREWISALRLDVCGQSLASGKIRRDSTFSCARGFKYFFRTVVSTVKDAVVRSRDFLGKRDQQSHPKRFARALKIEYDQPVFSDKRQNGRLVQTLKGLRNSALSVFHPNPYLHASLIDYADGSSYEIWVTTQNSILIVPKRKATTGSIERVCDFICDKFQEGEIKDFPGQ